jgi:hypothetical protein
MTCHTIVQTITGEVFTGADETGYYHAVQVNNQKQVFGSSHVGWMDHFGVLPFAGTLLGVPGHEVPGYFQFVPRSDGFLKVAIEPPLY